MKRECGDCTLCCKLLPVKEIDKRAGERCQHQCAKGCRIYSTAPVSCRLWSCAWLQGADLRRPDRAHYVVDILPDYVTHVTEAGERSDIAVIQVWIDPRYPEAHRDPTLRAYLAQEGKRNGFAAIIRFNNTDAIALFPPAMASDGEWHEITSNLNRVQEHSAAQKLDVFRRLGMAEEA